MRGIEVIANHATVSEKVIERYLVEKVKAAGGKALKYTNPFETGYPDRLCLLPGGVTFWVELKSKGCRPRPIQEKRHDELAALGQIVYVADSKEIIDDILKVEIKWHE